jgi:hypothetical protein
VTVPETKAVTEPDTSASTAQGAEETITIEEESKVTPPVTKIGHDDRIVIPPVVVEETAMVHMDRTDTPPVTMRGIEESKVMPPDVEEETEMVHIDNTETPPETSMGLPVSKTTDIELFVLRTVTL